MGQDHDGSLYLEGQVAIVTAAGGGIGSAVATALSARGARVVLQDLPTAEETVIGIVERITAAGGEALLCLGDATVDEDVSRPAALAMATWGRIDVLVNLVGGSVGPVRSPIWEQRAVDWQRTLDLNLTATFHATRAVLPTMMARRSGRIVNTASTAWAGHPNNAAYASAKAGVVGFTRTVSQQLAPYDINVNAVAPGISRTGALTRMNLARDGSDLPEDVIAEIPLRRINEPEDVADTISFLVSPAARNISGQLITVAGGQNPSL